ncbi:unnamed protein product, partial [Ectocarpus sp. 12 AP-2014]
IRQSIRALPCLGICAVVFPRSKGMADPWDVFGSDSDEDQPAAVTATPKPPPPRPPAAVSLPTTRRKKRLYAWESLLPRFQFPPGFDEGGIIEKR